MIPYLAPPVWHLGEFTVRGFGIAVAAALVTGYLLVLRRAPSVGISSLRTGRIFAGVTLVGLAVGHWWNGMSGMSGSGLAVGASVCLLACAAFGPFWATLDLFAYAAPATLAIARIGCFLAHDHVGRPSDSWLAVRFPDGSRYDLGLLQALAAGVAAMVLFVVARRNSRPGVICGSMLVLLAVGRLVVLRLGYARAVDIWFAVAMAAMGLVIVGLRGLRWYAPGRTVTWSKDRG